MPCKDCECENCPDECSGKDCETLFWPILKPHGKTADNIDIRHGMNLLYGAAIQRPVSI